MAAARSALIFNVIFCLIANGAINGVIPNANNWVITS